MGGRLEGSASPGRTKGATRAGVDVDVVAPGCPMYPPLIGTLGETRTPGGMEYMGGQPAGCIMDDPHAGGTKVGPYPPGASEGTIAGM